MTADAADGGELEVSLFGRGGGGGGATEERKEERKEAAEGVKDGLEARHHFCGPSSHLHFLPRSPGATPDDL